jgi:ADP-heptose:LPS heptosyltransferase
MINPSPLRGIYLVKNSFLYFFLKSIDFFSFVFFKKNKKIPKIPEKILLSNIAHLGDLVIATSVLPIIKKKFPKTEIGFICSSASRELIKNHHLIDKVYFLDHWKLNRTNSSFLKKFVRYFVMRFKIVRKLKKEKYDVAIDLYYYFPNTIYLFWKAKIPIRIGYTSGGFKNFLTHRLNWKNENKHVSEYQFNLLKFLGVDLDEMKNLKLTLPLFLLKIKTIQLPENYVIFHIGAGHLKKMWDLKKWKKLTDYLIKKGIKIVFTGKGKEENKQIDLIIENQENCINLCDKLNLLEMIGIIQKAKMIVCVDSLILHVASALQKKTIVIYSSINNYRHWVLKKEWIFPVIKNLKCCPCYLKNGCKPMDCLNKITVEDVLSTMEKFFEKSN